MSFAAEGAPSLPPDLEQRTIKVEFHRPKLYRKQSAAIFCQERIAIIEASTKSGKTSGCIGWLTEKAFGGKPGHNYWWVAPVSVQADIAFRRAKRALPRGTFTPSESLKAITLLNGCVIWFKSADKPDTLYGEDVYAAVIDEASRVKAGSWHAVRTTLTATRGPIRIIGNVKGRFNWFYALARKAEKGAPGMHYARLIAADAIDAGVLSSDEVADAKRDLPDDVFRELYMAQPSDDGGNPFGIKNIEACTVPALSEREPVAWGWDLAKSVNWTVGIGLDDGGHACRFERFQKPWPETLETIKRATDGGPAMVDSTGVGDPIVDLLHKDLGSNFEGFKFTSQSKQQIMEGLAVGIQKREVLFPEGPIVIELQAFEYEYTRTGVKYSAPAGFDDDCVCSLALAHHCRMSRGGLQTLIRAYGDD